MTEKEDKENKTTPLTMVGPGADAAGAGDEDQDQDTRGQLADGDEPRGEEDERDAPRGEREDEGGEERVGQGREDDDDERRRGIREHRRQQRHARKERGRRDQVELRFLRERNEALERRFSEQDARIAQTEVASVDGRITQLQGLIDLADRTYAEAVSAQKGDEASEANKIRSELQAQLTEAQNIRKQVVEGAQKRRDNQGRTAIPPEIAAGAQDWMDRNDWFDPTLRDEDSAIAKAVEQTLARDRRFDPRTEEYWEELDRRVAKRLPHLYESQARNGNGHDRDRDRDEDQDDDEDDRGGERRSRPEQRRGGGPRITTGGRERPLKKGEVYVDAERRKAMEEAGVWDDPVLREKYLRSYQKYDQDNGVRRRA